MLDKYKLIGHSYDLLSKIYSGNAIQSCKISMLRQDTIHTGSKVLFAGSGQGRDAIRAAELGAHVTLIDISPTMMDTFLELLAKHPDKDQLHIETILGDILKHETFSKYDMVVANFFLTIFEEDRMHTLLDHLIKLCKPQGRIVIGDFCPPKGGIMTKTFQQLYWFSAATAFFAFAGNALHQVYDYQSILEKKNLEISEHQYFAFLGRDVYHAIMAQKQ